MSAGTAADVLAWWFLASCAVVALAVLSGLGLRAYGRLEELAWRRDERWAGAKLATVDAVVFDWEALEADIEASVAGRDRLWTGRGAALAGRVAARGRARPRARGAPGRQARAACRTPRCRGEGARGTAEGAGAGAMNPAYVLGVVLLRVLGGPRWPVPSEVQPASITFLTSPRIRRANARRVSGDSHAARNLASNPQREAQA